MTQSDSPVHQLTLRVDPVPNADYPSLTILIDGDDVLSEDDRLQGFPAEAMLGPDSPLLPAPGGRRVGVYLCGCGISGCAVSAPWIACDARQVVWSDFRNYVGVFEQPLAPDEEIHGGRIRRGETFRFDAQLYVAEVERASADTTWRTPRRLTIDFVNASLATLSGLVASQGLRALELGPSHVDPSYILWASSVESRGPRGYRIEPPDGDPKAQANLILEYLRSTPATQWTALVHEFDTDDTAR